MYAIVESGGKQYRVEKGQTLLVDRLHAEQGATVELRPLLYRSDEAVFEPRELGRVRVEAVVAEHLRGPKIRIFKYKPKKGYSRQAGHRSELTRLEVKEISVGAGPRTKAAVPKPPAKKPEASPAPRKRSAGRTGGPAKKEDS